MSEPIPENTGYESVTEKVVEVRTPNFSTRFHAPNEKVKLERELLEIARNQRKVQGIKVVLPNSRGMTPQFTKQNLDATMALSARRTNHEH